jgi:preprotein translocase subunit SecA
LEGGLLSKSLENAQKKIEMYNYDLRKNIFDYDNILNYQRKVLFKARKEILLKNLYEDLFLRYNEMTYDLFIKKKTFFVANFETSFGSYSLNTLNLQEDPYQELWITNDLKFSQDNFYEPGFLQNTKSIDFLLTIDFYWTEHLERMSYVRETISWGSYGQQNPLSEYNIQAFQSFKLMFKQIRTYMLYYF